MENEQKKQTKKGVGCFWFVRRGGDWELGFFCWVKYGLSAKTKLSPVVLFFGGSEKEYLILLLL